MNGESITAFLGADFLFRNALVGGLLVTTLCAVLGVYVALRRIVLVGVALPQVAAAGVAFAFWITGHGHGADETAHGAARLGALGATFAALLYLVRRRREGATPAEWRVGAVLAVSMAATILFVALNPRGDLELTSLLRGDLLAIPDEDLELLAIAWTVTLGLFLLFRRPLLLVSFDPEYARTLGFSTLRYDALLYGLLGVAIGLGVMTAGPLVVFGFLVLPPLAALRAAPGIGAAFLLSLGVACAASLGGFVLAYRADLPTGPAGVSVAALLWLFLVAFAGVRRALARHASSAILLLTLLGPSACATAPEVAGPAPAGSRGTLPALPEGTAVSVLRVHDATGERLRIPSSNPLREVARAAGDPFQPKGDTVPDRLQGMTAIALASRGVAVRDPAEVRRLLSEAPATPAAAAAAARRAGIDGLVIQSTLRRFARTGSDLLLVQLDVALVDPADGRLLWTGSARGPYPVRGALTLEEVLVDVDGPLFAEVFGPP